MISDRQELARNWSVVIIGGGLAGIATAASCARRGLGPILLVEQESLPGRHSSGRNAGLVRQVAEDPVLTALCREGTERIEQIFDPAVTGSPFQRTGSLIFDGDQEIAAASWDQVQNRSWSEAQLREVYPQLSQLPPGEVRHVPGDGTLEVPALIGHLLAEARRDGELHLAMGQAAHSPRIEGGRVTGICIGDQIVPVDQLVVANGAWAGEWSHHAGVPVDLNPTLRSCITTTSLDSSDRCRPWIWAHDPGWYLKGCAGEWLWCGCEEWLDRASVATVEEDPWPALLEKVSRYFPTMQSLQPLRRWAGHRTFTADRRFLLGPDPRVSGWNWAVGLGGHGVTAATAVGDRVAAAIVSGSTAVESELLWSSQRFEMNRVGTP